MLNEVRKFTLAQLVRGGLIAAVYAVLALAFPEISYGIIQFRLSESLALLPRIFPEAILGLTVGCFIANLGSPYGLIDILGGTLCTLLASWLTWRLRHHTLLAMLPPILVNGLGVSAYVAWLSRELYFAVMPLITLSQAVVVICLGFPLYTFVARRIGAEPRE